jgi:DNA helicase-2/ATP-dependent DNA helicase PcrA
MGRVLNVPRRGIGEQTRAQLEGYMAERGQPMLAVLRDLEQDQTLGPRVRKETAALVHLLDDLALRARDEREVAPILEALIDGIGYRDYVRHADEQDFRTRLEVVDEFVSMCAGRDAENPKGLETFLQDLALVTDADTWDPTATVVTLMTCHTAKGLEFDHVFLAGLEESMLPHGIALETADGLEEERRLAYVAMTRARKRLTLSHARARLVYGERQDREPSRFLAEMGRERLEAAGDSVKGRESARPPARDRADTASRPRRTRPPAPPKTEPGALKMGAKVRHAKFGPGVVMFTSGSGRKQKARIKFRTGRSRDFIVSVAPLEILEE